MPKSHGGRSAAVGAWRARARRSPRGRSPAGRAPRSPRRARPTGRPPRPRRRRRARGGRRTGCRSRRSRATATRTVAGALTARHRGGELGATGRSAPPTPRPPTTRPSTRGQAAGRGAGTASGAGRPATPRRRRPGRQLGAGTERRRRGGRRERDVAPPAGASSIASCCIGSPRRSTTATRDRQALAPWPGGQRGPRARGAQSSSVLAWRPGRATCPGLRRLDAPGAERRGASGRGRRRAGRRTPLERVGDEQVFRVGGPAVGQIISASRPGGRNGLTVAPDAAMPATIRPSRRAPACRRHPGTPTAARLDEAGGDRLRQRCVMRRRCSVLGICWVAEIQALERRAGHAAGAAVVHPGAGDQRAAGAHHGDAAAQPELLGLVDGALDEAASRRTARSRSSTSVMRRPCCSRRRRPGTPPVMCDGVVGGQEQGGAGQLVRVRGCGPSASGSAAGRRGRTASPCGPSVASVSMKPGAKTLTRTVGAKACA